MEDFLYWLENSLEAIYWVMALYIVIFVLPIVVGRYIRASYVGRRIAEFFNSKFCKS